MLRHVRLHCVNFRNMPDCHWSFHPRLNLISGANGSGKTCLLEALYVLARGKSFRDSNPLHLIRHEQSLFRLIDRFNDDTQEHLLGLERDKNRLQLRLDSTPLNSLAQLAEQLPTLLINSDTFALLNEGPMARRRFIDYGVYYQDPVFLEHWRRYSHALRSRNAALKQNWPTSAYSPLHQMLAEHALHIDRLRRVYCQRLEERFNHYHHRLGGLDALSLSYQAGWNHDLAEQLDAQLEYDRSIRQTRSGPHRADLRLRAGEHDPAHHYSRGQQKTLLTALVLAQADLIASDHHSRPIILLDDLGAELDAQRQELLLRFLLDSGSQLFITAIEHRSLNDLPHQDIRLDASIPR